HGSGWNQVAAADLGAIDLEFARRLVGEPLEHIAGLGASRAAISIGWHGVAEDAGHFNVYIWCAIHPGEQRAVDRSGNCGAKARHIRTEVGAGVDVQREKAALAVQSQLSARDMVPALRVR